MVLAATARNTADWWWREHAGLGPRALQVDLEKELNSLR